MKNIIFKCECSSNGYQIDIERETRVLHGEKWMFNYGTAILNVQL